MSHGGGIQAAVAEGRERPSGKREAWVEAAREAEEVEGWKEGEQADPRLKVWMVHSVRILLLGPESPHGGVKMLERLRATMKRGRDHIDNHVTPLGQSAADRQRGRQMKM